MIPFADFHRLLGDVSECTDVEQYIAECSGSVPLDDAGEVLRLLRAVWAMADGGLTVKKIAAACGRSVRSLSRGYDIPERTLEDWSRGAIAPRAWTLPLVAYAVLTDHLAESVE